MSGMSGMFATTLRQLGRHPHARAHQRIQTFTRQTEQLLHHTRQHAVEHGTGVRKRPCAQLGTATQLRQQRRHHLPFFVGHIAVRLHDFPQPQLSA